MTRPQTPPTALISWTHRDPGWSDQQAEDWTARVVTFAVLLRKNGIDAELDLWQSSLEIDWTRWGQQMVSTCDFVIIVASAAWKDRWEGGNDPTVGAGAVAESDALKGRFNSNQGDFQRHTLVVLLPEVTLKDVPHDLHRLNRFQIKTVDNLGIDALLRALTGQPLHTKPPLGTRPVLGPLQTGTASNIQVIPDVPYAAMAQIDLERNLQMVDDSISDAVAAADDGSTQRSRETARMLRGSMRGLKDTHPEDAPRDVSGQYYPVDATQMPLHSSISEVADQINSLVPACKELVQDHELSYAHYRTTDSLLGRKLALLERSGPGNAGAKFAILRRLARENQADAQIALDHSRKFRDILAELTPLVEAALRLLTDHPENKSLLGPFLDVLALAQANSDASQRDAERPDTIASDGWWEGRTHEIKAASQIAATFRTASELSSKANSIVTDWSARLGEV